MTLHLQEQPAMIADGAEAWLAGIMSELNDLTWMGLAGDPGDPILTRRGMRPGSSFADITFGGLLIRILDFRHQLHGTDTDRLEQGTEICSQW